MNIDVEQTINESFLALEECLGRAVEKVPVANAFELLDLLPDCPPTMRRLIAGELIKLDMAKASEKEQLRKLDFYDLVLKAVYSDGAIPMDLVLEEIQVRRKLGDTLRSDELQNRYPHLAENVDEWITRPASASDSSLINKSPIFSESQMVDEFIILRPLGHGGFANVYLARQESMMRLVALKVSSRASDEPIALSQLDHPNIVRVYDQRRIHQPDAHLLYMEYVPGGTLANVILATRDHELGELDGKSFLDCVDRSLLLGGQQKPERSRTRDQLSKLDWSSLVAWIGLQLAEGISAAHQRGIMHRDIKPANILVSAEGIPKLADFNVSFGSMAGCAGAAVYFGGSLSYMSPEQLHVSDPSNPRLADDLDERSDFYSLAIVLWEVWQGRRPNQATEVIDSWSQAILQQLRMRRQSATIVRATNSATARVLEKTLRRALNEDRELRPRTGREFAGHMRLALNTQAAELFEPADNSWRARILKLPTFLVTAVIVMLPNSFAGALNYQYNYHSVSNSHLEMIPFFVRLSLWVNCIAFPVGALLLVWLVRPLQIAKKRMLQGLSATEMSLDAAWNLGYRASMIGGLLWLVAGVAFSLAMGIAKPTFGMRESIEFFLSLAICGGIAWIYPFFGASLISMMVYYPALIAPTMSDTRLSERIQSMKIRARNYLATAAAIPLIALGLLSLVPSESKAYTGFLLMIVILTGISLPFAFAVYQRLLDHCRNLATVLSDESGDF